MKLLVLTHERRQLEEEDHQRQLDSQSIQTRGTYHPHQQPWQQSRQSHANRDHKPPIHTTSSGGQRRPSSHQQQQQQAHQHGSSRHRVHNHWRTHPQQQQSNWYGYGPEMRQFLTHLIKVSVHTMSLICLCVGSDQTRRTL